MTTGPTTTGPTTVGLLLERLPAWLRPERRAPLPPRVAVDGVVTLPGWALRLALLALAGVCVAPLAEGRTAPWVVAVVLAAAVARQPGGAAPAVFAVVAGIQLLVVGTGGWHPRTFLVLFGVHALVWLAALNGDLPPDGRLERRALARSTIAFLRLQLPAQALAVVGTWAAVGGARWPWLPLLATIGFAGAAMWAWRHVEARA